MKYTITSRKPLPASVLNTTKEGKPVADPGTNTVSPLPHKAGRSKRTSTNKVSEM